MLFPFYLLTVYVLKIQNLEYWWVVLWNNYFHLFEEHSEGDKIKIVQTAQSTQVVRKRWFFCRYFTRFQVECHYYNLITRQSNGSWYNKFGFVNNCGTANCWCSCARYWKVGCKYQCLCCFPLPSKLIPFFKITSQKWLFHMFYCKIDLLNRNPIDQKLACWRHPVPLNWPLDPQFRGESLPQYWC